MDETNNNMWIN